MVVPFKLFLLSMCLSLLPVCSSAEQSLEALDKEFLEFLSMYIDADAELIDKVLDAETASDQPVEESSPDESN